MWILSEKKIARSHAPVVIEGGEADPARITAFHLYTQKQNPHYEGTMQKRAPRHKGRNVLFYAAGDTNANLRYGCRFSAPDPFTFVRTKTGRRWLLMSDLEIDRARKESNAHQVFSLSDYTRRARERLGRQPAPADVIAGFLKAQKIRGVSVSADFPLGMAEKLRALGIGVTVLPDPFFPERTRKSAAEIREIKQAMRATERGIREGVEALERCRIRGGYLYYKGKRLTSEILRSIINTTILRQGYIPMYTIVAGGKQGCDPHDSGSGPLRAHQPIIIDVFPRSESTGYYADMTRTVVRGKASDRVRRMYDAVLAGQRLGLSMIKHGAHGRPIHQAIHRLFQERGFETGEVGGRMQGFFHGTGHGLGLDIHEPPRIGPLDDVLEAGSVVTVEPGLYYYPHGGVRIEDTVLVTRGGIDNLTRFPKFLEI